MKIPMPKVIEAISGRAHTLHVKFTDFKSIVVGTTQAKDLSE